MSTRISPLKARNILDTALRTVAEYLDKIAPIKWSGSVLEGVDEDCPLDLDLDEIPSIDLSELWEALLGAYSVGQDRLASWVQGKKGAYKWIEVWHEFNHGHMALIPTIEQIQDAGDSRLEKLYLDFIAIVKKIDSCDLTSLDDSLVVLLNKGKILEMVAVEETEKKRPRQEAIDGLIEEVRKVERQVQALADPRAKIAEVSQLKQAPAKGQEMEELETIKKELESKAQALAEALGRIAELEQELAGLQAELEGATEEELDEGVDTPYTYIARQPKDRNRRMGLLVAIIERAEGAGLLVKQMNTQRLRWSEHYSNGQIAYFVARANSLLGIKARQYNATNWKVWDNLVAGLGDTQLKYGKATYSKRGGSDKPLGHESIDELFVSL